MNALARLSPEETTRRVEQLILTNKDQRTPGGLFAALMHHAHCDGKIIDFEVAITHWWDLARIGAVALIGGGSDSFGSHHPAFVLTDFGRKLLSDKGPSPHDRAGYLASIRNTPSADTIAIEYADEAVGAWQAALYRASAVMLGCACERLVLLLADTIQAAGISPFSNDLALMRSPRKGKKAPRANISDVFEKVRGAVEVVGGDDFDRLVSSVFDHARELRNESGHPTGRSVSKQEAQAGLLLFPGYHERVLEIIDRIRNYKS